jgi:hypothetical protein
VGTALAALLGAALSAMPACGGDDSSNGDGGQGDGGPQGDGAICGAAACGSNVCGSVKDSCGDVVACGMCRYTGEPVDGYSDDIVLAVGAQTEVAYAGVAATRGSGSWTTSTFSTAAQAKSLDIALATDGTPWVLFTDGTDLLVAHFDGANWITETLPNAAYQKSGAVAVAGDGTPTVVYPGTISTTSTVVLARRVSGTWSTSSVATPSGQFVNVALAMIGSEAQIAWHDLSSGVMFAHGSGAGPFSTEVVDATAVGKSNIGTSIGGAPDELGIGVDGAGTVHVAYKDGSDQVAHAARVNGAWTHEEIPRLSMFSQYVESSNPLRLAVSPSGDVAVGTVGEDLTILTLSGGAWLEQPVARKCSTADFDLAFDASGNLAIAHSCSGHHFMIASGAYPPDYAGACQQIVDGWCNEACSCPKDQAGKCCVNGTNGSICTDPPPLCQSEFVESPCADATLDPTVTYGCRDAVTQTTTPTCTAPDAGSPGMVTQPACSTLF